MPSEVEPLLHTCPKCGALLDISEQEPFSEIVCPSCGESMRVRTRFDHFEILDYIASGGMGTVYRARDVNLNRILALKLLRKEYSADTEYIEKLETEAKITASVAHPYVVEVFSFGCDQGVYYIAMELVDKGSLDDLMTLQGRIAEAQVLEIGSQVAQGLRAAYQAGLIHRDVKPGNILFADAHTAKIVDFGLAMPLEQAQEGESEIWGTPYYVAPEKLNHEPEDFRSDIYSLGGTLFHALAGRPPFEAENASLVALKHLKSQVVSLQAFAPDISSPTTYVINRTLAKNPADRYQSYDELIEHLEYARTQLLENIGKSRQPKARVVMEDEKQENVLGYIMVAVIAFTLVVGMVLYFFWDNIMNRSASVEELARMQSEHSSSSVESTLAIARKQIFKGDPQGAFKATVPLEKRPNLTEFLRAWIAVHECIAKLAAGEFWSASEIATKLHNEPPARGREAVEEDHLRNFVIVFKSLMETRERIAFSEAKTVSADRFESLGYLIDGLKEWDASRFESADGFFQTFLETKPKGNEAWINDFKPLAQRYRDDYKTFQALDKQIKSADTAEKRASIVNQIPGIKAKLKLAGRLPEDLDIYKKSLLADSMSVAGSGPRSEIPLSVLRDRVAQRLNAMQPTEAKQEITATPVSTNDTAGKQALLQKVNYIDTLKRMLIWDLKQPTADVRWVARRSGPVLSGRITQINDAEIQIESNGSTVSVPWPDVMPSSVLVWADSVRTASSAAAKLWLGGAYATLAGYPKEGKARLQEAAEKKTDYAKDLPLFDAAP